jgi:transposase
MNGHGKHKDMNSSFILVQFIFRGKNMAKYRYFNPLSPELNPICYLLALLAHDFLHVSSIRVKSLTLRLLMSYIYIYIYIYIYMTLVT